MFLAVDLLGKKAISMSTIDTTDLITRSIVDTLMPMLRKVQYTCLILRLKAVPRPEGFVLNTLSDTSILQLLCSSVRQFITAKLQSHL